MNCGATQMTQRIGDWSLPGSAGNSMSPALVANPKNKDELFLYHNDESQHAGVHRWKVSGISSVLQLAEQSLGQLRAEQKLELDRRIGQAAADLEELRRQRSEL